MGGVNSTTVRPVGRTSLLVTVDDPLAWDAELRRRRDAGELVAVDIVPGAGTVLLDGVPDPAAVATWLRGLTPPAADPAAARHVDVPVAFDGPDLDLVARHWGRPDVVTVLRETTFRVAFCGFAPGFGYLAGLPRELAVPRRDDPRTRVPAGSVGLAGPYAGIYPTASPGGWLLVGHTDVRLFDVDGDPPALLTPGTTVRFVT